MNKKETSFYLAALVIGFALSCLYAAQQILTGDQLQMIAKGYLGAHHGVWLSYGNAASAMGNVPGSLSAWLVGGPLLLWDSPYAPMLLLLVLKLISFLLFDDVIRREFGPRGRLLFMVLYWLNPWFLYESILYNPAYLFFAAALHFWSAYRMRAQPSFICSLLHVVSIGFAMQLHYSWPLLAVISGCLFWRKLMRLNGWGVMAGVLLLAASLIPYLHEVFNQPQLARADADTSDRYIGWGLLHVYPLLKSLIYWLRYGSWIFSTKLINGTTFDWLGSAVWLQQTAVWIWRCVVYLAGAGSLVLTLLANRYVWRLVRPHLSWRWASQPSAVTSQVWLGLYVASAVVAILVCAALAPIVFSYWHLMLVFPFALLPLMLFSHTWLERAAPQFMRYLTAASIFCLLVNLVAANDSRKFSYQADYAAQTQAWVSSMTPQDARSRALTQSSEGE